MYWVSIAFSAILVVIVGEGFTRTYHGAIYLPKNYTEVIRNVFLVLSHNGSPRLSPPAWALTVELFYYILIGLGISRTRRRVHWWLFIGLAYHVIVVGMGLDGEYRYYPIPAASLPFATGAIICHYRSKLHGLLARLSVTARGIMPIVVFAVILTNWAVGQMARHSGAYFYSNYVLCALMVAVLYERTTLPYVTRKFDKWMGDFSYPVYLMHYQAGLIVAVTSTMIGYPLERPDYLLFLLSFPLVFILSGVITLFIEKPIDLIRRRIKTPVIVKSGV